MPRAIVSTHEASPRNDFLTSGARQARGEAEGASLAQRAEMLKCRQAQAAGRSGLHAEPDRA